MYNMSKKYKKSKTYKSTKAARASGPSRSPRPPAEPPRTLEEILKPGGVVDRWMPASEARAKFAETLERAKHRYERSVLHRRGKPIAAIVPVEDLKLIEEMEDIKDLRLIEERADEPSIPYDQVRREFGLA